MVSACIKVCQVSREVSNVIGNDPGERTVLYFEFSELSAVGESGQEIKCSLKRIGSESKHLKGSEVPNSFWDWSS